MSEYSTSQRSPSVARPTRTTPQRPERRVTPTEFAQWLEGRLPSLQVRWTERIRSTGRMRGDVWDGLIADFVVLITSTLPTLLGPHRDEVEPLWVRAAELFGTAASRRGLAAGEAVEELQILRELVIRDLYGDPPLSGSVPVSLKEVLRLNRAIDRVVTHGSIGHTDALFFQLLEDDGRGGVGNPTLAAAEIERQLSAIRGELAAVLAVPGGEPHATTSTH